MQKFWKIKNREKGAAFEWPENLQLTEDQKAFFEDLGNWDIIQRVVEWYCFEFLPYDYIIVKEVDHRGAILLDPDTGKAYILKFKEWKFIEETRTLHFEGFCKDFMHVSSNY